MRAIWFLAVALASSASLADSIMTTRQPAGGYANFRPAPSRGMYSYNPAAPQQRALPQPTYQAGYANGYQTGYQNGYGRQLRDFDRSTQHPQGNGRDYWHGGRGKWNRGNGLTGGNAPFYRAPAYGAYNGGYGQGTQFYGPGNNSRLTTYNGAVYSGSSSSFRYGPQSSITISR